jgi:hypothetical protein
MLKQTEHISRKMTQNIYRAFDFAKVMGTPLNQSVILQLRETHAQAATTIFDRIRHKYRDWLSHHSRKALKRYSPAYVYTFEAKGNPHVNWALYVPPELLPEFATKLPKWIAKVQGELGDFDLHRSPIDPSKAYKSLADYILKGCDPAFIEHFHLQLCFALNGPQGTFWGKRAGVSPSLNKTARDAAGYDARRRRLRRSVNDNHRLPETARKAI